MKTCTKCNTTKSLNEFGYSHEANDGLRNWCRECFAAYNKQRYSQLTPEYSKGRALVRYWPDLAPLEAYEKYQQLISLQGGACAICRRPSESNRSLHVDHCHITNAVRGLLCEKCNSGLGMFKDNQQTLNNASSYIERNNRIYNSISDAYLGTLHDVYFNPEYICSPRGQKCREKTDYTFKVLNPTSDPIITKDIDRNIIIARYTQKEKELYDSGTNLASDFGKASKFWLNISNVDGTINSAYGYLIWKNKSHGNALEGLTQGLQDFNVEMRTPWEYCVMALKADKDTRQAVLRFSLPEHFWVGNRDMTCTLHGNWLIRNDKLHLSMVLRSQDMVKGAVYDWPWFCSLMDKMLQELQPSYPTLTKGYYTHTAHSAHIYEKDDQVVRKMLGLMSREYKNHNGEDLPHSSR
jgi:thymidylate synthase